MRTSTEVLEWVVSHAPFEELREIVRVRHAVVGGIVAQTAQTPQVK